MKKMLALGLSAVLLVGNIIPAYAVETLNETAEVSAPSLSMVMEDGEFTGELEVTNNDADATSVYYGIATKEEIEQGITFNNSCYMDFCETTYFSVTNFLHARISEPGEFYFVAYTEDDAGAVSAITAIEDYKITISQTTAKESAVYKTGSITDYEYFLDVTSDVYMYADLMLMLTDDWGNKGTIVSWLEKNNGTYYFDDEIYDEWYSNWDIEKLVLWDVDFGTADCTIEQTIYTTIEDGGIYEEPRTEEPAVSLFRDENGNPIVSEYGSINGYYDGKNYNMQREIKESHGFSRG